MPSTVSSRGGARLARRRAGRGGERRLLEQADLDLERRLGAVAEHHHVDGLADLGVGDDAHQLAGVVDRLAAEAQHHVARLHAGRRAPGPRARR